MSARGVITSFLLLLPSPTETTNQATDRIPAAEGVARGVPIAAGEDASHTPELLPQVSVESGQMAGASEAGGGAPAQYATREGSNSFAETARVATG